MNIKLYLPEKYPVIIGEKKGIGIVTCWTDTEILLKKYPELLNSFQIMGTLYSTEGVSIILRNLALNPNITKLVVWTDAQLSKTPIGIKGYNLLKSLWENGIDNEHNVINTDFKVHKEISIEVISKIRENVELIDISDKTEDEFISYIESLDIGNNISYMESIDFIEPERSELATLPSEHAGFAVHGTSIVNTWLKVVEKILRYGDEKPTHKELNSITWSIHDQDSNDYQIPDWPKSLLETISLNKDAIDKYKNIILTANNDTGTSYTYGERLFNYNHKINQIEFIINDLKRDKYSRRSSITTIIPEIDIQSSNPPCLNLLQVLIDTKDQLNMFVVFRSHDIFKAAISNAYGLRALQEYIAKEVGVKVGILSVTSVSAHIYSSDLEDALKLIKCQFWEDINIRFNENEDMDYRGIVVINVTNNKIDVELKTLNGENLFELSGKTARELATKIAKLDLLYRKDHLVDITIELVKAELAIKTGQKYEQDKLIKVNQVSII